jgi:NADPH:quinone reductase-like Zn-dependent oxidoreductase/SAM-dependent methyltransferase
MFEDAKVAVKGFELRNAEFMSALSLERDGKIEVETRLRTLQGRQSSRLVDRGYDFRIYSVRDQHWTLHCQGIIYGMVSEMLPTRSVPRECEYPKDGTGTLLNTNEVYDLLTRSGYHYGPSFRLLTRLHREGNQTFATLTAPTTQICERLSIQDPHIIHPAALDAVLQLGLIGVSSGEERRIPTILPTRIRSLKIVSSGLNICSDVCTIELSSNSRINDVGKLLCSANAYGLLSGKRLLNLQIAGFEGTAISSTDKDIQESSKAMCFQISWKPDLDTLSSGEILDLCWSGSSQESEKELISFERDCTVLIFHAIQKTLEAMENGSLQLDPSRAYLRKYHSWMKEQVHAFHSGAYSEIHSRYYDITRDARKLDQVKRAALEDKRWRLYTTVAESLAKILVGSEDPLQILFGRNLATDFYNESNRYSSCAPALKKYVELLSHKNPAMRILEVGAGTGGATRLALEAITSGARAGLGERYSCYDFTDVSPSLIASAKEEFGGSYPRMRFFTYDVEKLPIAQEANVASYDLVIAASVLHATADIRNTLRNVRSQLKPGGKLLLWEGVKPQHVRMSFVFGLLPGWHLSIEDFRQFSPCLSSSTWHTLLSEEGFSGVDVEFRDFSQEESHETSILVATATEESPSVSVSLGVDRLFIFGDLYDPTEMALCNELRKSFYESLGIGCTLAPFGALSGSSFAIESAILLPRVTASLLPARSSEEFLSMQGLLVRASVLLWVSESSDPRQSIIDGLSRTLRSERNDLRMTTISLQQSSTSVSHQAQLIDKAFCQMSTSDDYEPEYREKNGTLEVNRILQYPSLSESVIESSSHATVHAGINLSRHLESDEVEISVHSSNSSHYCSGWITRLGTNCHDLDVGDSVAAITPRFSGNLAVAQSHLIMPLPFKVSSARTASLLLPFGAAYHALVDVARITSSETVLININHTETRSSAIQIALHLGANVFVAVDPSTDRNAITSQFDLAFDHVLAYDGDALSTSIYQQMAHTGIDVVISDTSHLAIPRIIECGAPYSQFIFIRSHQDLFDDAIGTLPSGTTKYARVDLLTMAEAHPKILSRIMRKAIDVMLDLTLSPDDLDEDSPLSGSRRPKFSLAIDATYVIAGGLGGIGQSVARWMVSKGAKHLLLLNRSGAKDATAIEFIKELTDAGVHVSAPRCDISKAEELSEVLRPYGTVKPAIRGCVQASMSLKVSYTIHYSAL